MGRRAVAVDPNAYAYGLRRSRRDPNLKTHKSLVSTKTIPITPAKGEEQAPPTMSVWATQVKEAMTYVDKDIWELIVNVGIYNPFGNNGMPDGFGTYFKALGDLNDHRLEITLPQDLRYAKLFNTNIYQFARTREYFNDNIRVTVSFSNPLAIFPYNRRQARKPPKSPISIMDPMTPGLLTPEVLKSIQDDPKKIIKPRARPRGDRGTLNTPLYRDPHRPVFDNTSIPFPDLDEYADDYLVSSNTESSAPKTDGRKEKTGSHGAKGRPSAKYYFPGGYKTYNRVLKEWNEQHDGIWVSPMRGSQAWETIKRMARIRMNYDPTTRDKVHEAVLGTRKQ